MMIGPNVTVVDIGMVEAYASGLGEFYVDQVEHADVIWSTILIQTMWNWRK